MKKKRIYYNYFLSVLIIAFALWLGSCSEHVNEYRKLAVDYADYMIDKGRDHYGEVHAPVFLSMLNRTTDSIFKKPEENLYFDRSETGIRNIDRSLNGSNPFNDEGLYKLLYELSDDTGDEKYEKAADESLQWFILHTQHPGTKLIAWGEHLGYRCDLDDIVKHEENSWGHLKHEIHGYWSLWEKVFELTPEAAIEYAYAYWMYHVYDKDSVLHAHQTRYDTFDPDSGYIFPRMAGHMSYIWALAYRHSSNDTVKNDMCTFIDKTITTHNAKRSEKTKALFFYHPKEGIVFKPNGNMEGAYEVHRAMQIVLPDTILQKLEKYNKFSDQSICEVLQKPGKGVVSLADTLSNVISVDSTNLWCNSYGKASSLARRGVNLMRRYSQNNHQVYKNKALEIADQYIGQNPACSDYLLRPQALSAAIELQLDAHRITHDSKYLEQAFKFGNFAKNLFFDEKSPLPKVFSEKFNHYEAITGGADLMLSFYKLSKERN